MNTDIPITTCPRCGAEYEDGPAGCPRCTSLPLKSWRQPLTRVHRIHPCRIPGHGWTGGDASKLAEILTTMGYPAHVTDDPTADPRMALSPHDDEPYSIPSWDWEEAINELCGEHDQDDGADVSLCRSLSRGVVL